MQIREDEIERLHAIAARVFGSDEAASCWFEKPAIGLNRQRPVELLATKVGRDQVSIYLDQIEHGVYV